MFFNLKFKNSIKSSRSSNIKHGKFDILMFGPLKMDVHNEFFDCKRAGRNMIVSSWKLQQDIVFYYSSSLTVKVNIEHAVSWGFTTILGQFIFKFYHIMIMSSSIIT